MMPKVLLYGPYAIPVTTHEGFVTDREDTGDEGCWGECNFDREGLAIHVSENHYDPSANLIHEAMHAVYELTGARRTFGSEADLEVVVEATTHGVIELLRRNPDLVDAIIGG